MRAARAELVKARPDPSRSVAADGDELADGGVLGGEAMREQGLDLGDGGRRRLLRRRLRPDTTAPRRPGRSRPVPPTAPGCRCAGCDRRRARRRPAALSPRVGSRRSAAASMAAASARIQSISCSVRTTSALRTAIIMSTLTRSVGSSSAGLILSPSSSRIDSSSRGIDGWLIMPAPPCSRRRLVASSRSRHRA